ncbi:SAM-dependent methyltransferase [Gracilibacillus halotolerans]|uniref:SAM-dependent methyltransferase n=1 Tax=Gracilibacillus halotolerans TaxID=74386 RepID=A0A841RUN3_9BACI|nr:class I SAM-dependent methyltransferase [Gracilibacillus halotolerans]MBB6514178.1 SAM-dependent methyltransferase [Gracilibacillus halotolerans]
MSREDMWNAVTYDNKFNFVSEYGKSVIDLLSPNSEEKILDLGCGTGDLTYEISKTGVKVTGMDASPQMIKKAQQKYADIPFIVGNGEDFYIEETFDAVFSNAALHWMKNAENVVQSVNKVLRHDGRFVAEFGGRGNIATIKQGIKHVLEEIHGIDSTSRNPWYFPSIGEYSALLENNGFEVAYARLYDRPTEFPDGDQGLYHFLDQFADSFFYDLSSDEKCIVYKQIKTFIEPDLYKDGKWIADYRRLQMVAVKKS